MLVCVGCERPIMDRFLLNVLNRTWHASCVACSDCKCSLTEKCFSRDGKLYCRTDFFKRYGTKCAGCDLGISPCDLVRRAREKVFHLKCFTCVICQKQLSTGEELYVLEENKFICRDDYIHNKFQQAQGAVLLSSPESAGLQQDMSSDITSITRSAKQDSPAQDKKSPNSTTITQETNNNSKQHLPPPSAGKRHVISPVSDGEEAVDGSGVEGKAPEENGDTAEGLHEAIEDEDEETLEDDGLDMGETEEGGTSGKEGSGTGPGGKRRGPRTTIKAKQLETLKAAFSATPKPTRHIREQLATETGLSMRVIQVWFQNRRSKERRMKQLNAMGARRHFFRGPAGRRMRSLGGPEEMDETAIPGYAYYPGMGMPDYSAEMMPGPGRPSPSGLPPGLPHSEAGLPPPHCMPPHHPESIQSQLQRAPCSDVNGAVTADYMAGVVSMNTTVAGQPTQNFPGVFAPHEMAPTVESW